MNTFPFLTVTESDLNFLSAGVIVCAIWVLVMFIMIGENRKK